MQKYDAIQLASIKRSEAYLRKKAQPLPRTGYIREALTGAVFAATMIAALIFLLAL